MILRKLNLCILVFVFYSCMLGYLQCQWVNVGTNFNYDTNICFFVPSQAAKSYPVLLITLYLYINSILKIIRKSCVINLLRYIFI